MLVPFLLQLIVIIIALTMRENVPNMAKFDGPSVVANSEGLFIANPKVMITLMTL